MKYDVVIVGAGPGGLKAAEILAENNKQVLVLEQNKKIGEKVCAGGLTAKGMNWGIPKNLIERSFKKIKVHTPHDTTEIKSNKPIISTIDRKELGQWMLKKAKKAGAEIQTNSRVIEIKKDFVVTTDKKLKFDYLVGADGAVSIVRQSLNLKEKNFEEAFQYITPKKFKDIEIFFDINKFGSLYSWIFPHRNYTSIGTGGNPHLDIIPDIKKNFDKWCKDKFNIKKAKFQAALINYDYKGFQFKNKFLVGDAAGFTSGLTGEGIYFAIVSGEEAAKKIVNPKYRCPKIDEILSIKTEQEKLLRILQVSKKISPILPKIEYELLVLMLKSRLIDKELLKIVD